MKSNGLIGVALIGGALYLLMRRGGAAAAGGGDAWGPTGRTSVWDPSAIAAGSPSYAGSSGTGNLNPLSAALGTITNLIKGLTYRQTAASAPLSYGTPASPGSPTGPSFKTGVVGPSGMIATPLNYQALQDPSGFWEPLENQWSGIFTNAAIQATPAAIASQNVSQEFPLIYY